MNNEYFHGEKTTEEKCDTCGLVHNVNINIHTGNQTHSSYECIKALSEEVNRLRLLVLPL